MISDVYHNIVQLLLITIIPSNKSCMISVFVEQNITVNCQNRLMSHPYCMSVPVATNGQ